MSDSFRDQLAAAEPISTLCNVEAEIGLLGDMIANNRLIDDVADRCRGRDFSVPLYGRVFDKMLEQSAVGGNVDAVTLAPHFHGEPEWTRTLLPAVNSWNW